MKEKSFFKAPQNIVIAFLVLIVTGCASYKPLDKNGLSGGYEDKKTADNKYFVLFKGEAYDTSDSVLKLWKKRANELCKNGYTGNPEKGHWYFTYTYSGPGVPAMPMTDKNIKYSGEIECI